MAANYNFCFICFSNLTPAPVPLEAEQVVKRKRGRKAEAELIIKRRSSNSIKYLISYLLHTSAQTYDEVLKDVLKLAGVDGRDDGGGQQKRTKRRRRCSSKLLRLCERCEGVAGRILDLHLELEKLQMIIVNEVRTVRETVMRSSGWLGGGGSDNENETFENFSRRFGTGECGGNEKIVFESLKGFQTAVSETADKDSANIPFVYLQRSGITKPAYHHSIYERTSTSEIANIHIVKTEPLEREPEIGKHVHKTDPLSPEDSILPDDFFVDSDPNYQQGEDGVPSPQLDSDDEYRPSGGSDHEDHDDKTTSKLNVTPKRNKSKSTSLPRSGSSKKLKSTVKNKQSSKSNFVPPTVKRINRRYICDSCRFESRSIHRFEQHLMEHEHENEEDKPFHCLKCSLGFSTKQYYSLHEGRHNGAHKARCDVCQELIHAFELEAHMKSHNSGGGDDHDTVFPCSHCCQWLPSMERLMFHIKLHHFGKGMKCEVCEMKFKNTASLSRHLHSVHNLVKTIKCEVEGCGKEFLNRTSLYFHRNLHSDQFTCKECLRPCSSRTGLEIHMKLHAETTEKRFKCDQCPESFQYSSTFQTHLVRVHGAPKFSCVTCGKEFNSAGWLQQHHVLEHGAGKVCPVCGVKCVSDAKLAVHMQKHAEQKDYVCEECGKSFQTNRGYKTHMQIHGSRKFQCSYCPKGFTKKIYLIEHTRTHTGEKPFACDGCGKAFSQRGPLKNHIKGCQLYPSTPSSSSSSSHPNPGTGHAFYGCGTTTTE